MKLHELNIKKRGNKESRALCPECSHTRKKKNDPCLAINMETGAYYCHHCGTKGLLDDFKQEKNYEPVYEPVKVAVAELSGEHFEYFNNRGISLDTVKRNNITTSKKNPKYIAFNYYEGDEVMNVKFRHSQEKKWMQTPGGKPIFYGLNDIQEDYLIITEGEFDKLSWDEIGLTSCVSVPMGAPNENDKNVDGKLKCLHLAEQQVNAAKLIYLACDSDANGKRLTQELARRIGIEKCLKVEYPSDCKDANEVLIKHGKEALRKCYDNATPFPVEGVSRVMDFHDDVLDIFENGYPDGLTFGYREFDKLLKWSTGYLVTVVGIPTHGKSSFTEQMAIKLAARYGIKFGLFSPEHYPPQNFIQRLMRVYIGRPMLGAGAMSRQQFDMAMKFVHDHFFIIHANDDHTLESILDTSKQLVYRYGIKGLIIDPWTDIEHNIPRGDNESRYTAKALAKIKKFNRMNGVSTFLVVHPTKMDKNQDGTYRVPTLYDCSGSANFYNKSDFGVSVYRNPDNTVDVYIQKVKFEGILGEKGQTTFTYDKGSNRFQDMGSANYDIEQPALVDGSLNLNIGNNEDEGVPF